MQLLASFHSLRPSHKIRRSSLHVLHADGHSTTLPTHHVAGQDEEVEQSDVSQVRALADSL